MRVVFWSTIFMVLTTPAQSAPPKSTGSTRMLWKAEQRDCALSQPAVRGDLVFIGTCTGKFYAVRKNSGKQEWAYDAGTDSASGGFRADPILRDDIVLAGTEGSCSPERKGYLYAFAQHTGKVRWKLATSVSSNDFVVLGNSIIFGSPGGGVSVDIDTGQKKWGFEVAVPASCGAKTSIATDGVNVYFLAADGVIYCLEAISGRQLWKQRPSSTITTRLLVYKDVLYFGVSGHIESLNIANGQPLAQLKVPATPNGTFTWSRRGEEDLEYSYGTTQPEGKGALLAYSDEFERLLWLHETKARWTSGAPMPWKGVIVAGNCQGEVRAYEGVKGALKWAGQVDGCITGLEHDDSTLYIVVKEGGLYAFSPPTK